jgi:hypothetical protein
LVEFVPFNKIPRLSRDCVITEKLDGTNASIFVGEDGEFLVGSRSRWITPESDNFGFAKWATEHRDELMLLGPGHHFGEWWGQGVQRGYGLTEKRFSLFNVSRWGDGIFRPACCHAVPVLYSGTFCTDAVSDALGELIRNGSAAAPGFMNPEGVIIFHVAANRLFKKTIERDEEPKGKQAA